MDEQDGVRGSGLLLIDGGAPPDQALRLRRFREAHPDIEIILRGPWQAIITKPDGERTILRWELFDLLDKLDLLVAACPPEAAR